MNIRLELETRQKKSALDFHFQWMVNAGYVGKNQDEVRRHIEELAAKGIPGPQTTPTLYPVVLNALTTQEAIEVYGEKSSGEVEYVLLVKDRDEVFVGLGSDHTDRFLEEVDIPRSKQICPNIMSRVVWPLKEVEAHWDDIVMSSTVTCEGKAIPYQEGRLGLLLNPAELLEFVQTKLGGPLKDIVIFSGTMGMIGGEFLYGQRFSAELIDPHLDRRLGIDYQVKPLDYLTVD